MTLPFQLNKLPSLARSVLDRQEVLRSDPERLRSQWSQARVVVLDELARSPVRIGENQLAGRTALAFDDVPPEKAMFLGQWGGVDYWSIPGTFDGEPELMPEPTRGRWRFGKKFPKVNGEVWVDLLAYGDLLDDMSASLFTTAQALHNWHRQTPFCARCGNATLMVDFGWATECVECHHKEYPRTDPATIILVHDDVGVNGERVLLARQSDWQREWYSVLAGFVEAGESLEACVSREILEEVGVTVDDVRYLGSQPWPFPRSIMLGFSARADASRPLCFASGEIEDARWVTREDVLTAIESESGTIPVAGTTERIALPGNVSIAGAMLEAWAYAETGI